MKIFNTFITLVFISLFANLLVAEETDHSQHQMSNSTDSMDHSQHQMIDHSAHENKNDMTGMEAMEGMDHMHHNMSLDAEGMVMNSNDSKLPQDCEAINKEYNISVKAGTKYSVDFPGTIFGLDQHEIKVEPCSLLHITFINEDHIRHQWMVHGLPKYLYDQGMFHLEAAGGAQKSGSLIVPSDNKTYLIHCDIAQHMEKGMKAQLVVGKGNGDLPSIPGISGAWANPD